VGIEVLGDMLVVVVMVVVVKRYPQLRIWGKEPRMSLCLNRIDSWTRRV